MAYGLQDIVIKLFNVVPTLNVRKDKRSGTFNDSYCFQFSLKPKEQIIREDKICVQIKNLYREEKQLKVFNFEVKNDNSYTVNNVIVHNCQDISVAGKQKGFEHDGERTRSGLFFEALRIIEFLQPEYAICENVKALTSKKFEKEFNTVLNSLAEVGYNNYWSVLNAKDYGIPQNRERVFIISIRKDIDTGAFTFPEKQELKLRVKDILENSVDEKYYINTDKAKELIKKFIENNQIKEIDQNPKIQWCGSYNGHQSGNVVYERGICNCIDVAGHVEPQKIMISEPKIKRLGNLYDENAGGARAGNVYAPDGLAPALQTAQGGNRQPLIFSNDPVICRSVGRDPDNPSNRKKGCNTEQTLELKKDGMSNTLTTVQKDNYVLDLYRIRKLTPRECFRLMGFTDADFDKIKGISNTQLYKMAGNSIVVNVLEAIFKQLFKENHKE